MANETQIPSAIFPDYPRVSPVVDKEGNFVPLMDLGIGLLFQALQTNFKNEGIVFPALTAAQMTTIQDLYTSYIGGSYNNLTLNLPDISGQTVYDATTQISNQFIIAQDNFSNVTLAQWVPLAVMLTYAGNPDMNIAGVLNWLCYDTTDKALYACYTAGAAGTARWAAL